MNNILIAIPVWRGNAEQVLANLEQQFQRDGKTKHHAIVCYDGTVNTEPPVMAAMKCFEVVHELIYDELKTDEPWPRKQNHCWQSIARKLEEAYIDKYRGWFFWEHDVLPLKKGWIDALEKAYIEGRRPFMGHIVPIRGHMNGVAIYPLNISQYATKAFLVKRTPFDVALSEEVKKDSITEANHLMAHHPKVRGGDPAKPLTQHALSMIPETSVTVHGYYVRPILEVVQQVYVSPEDRKEEAMKETSKAMRRRRCEEMGGGFNWSAVFKGKGIDIGAGNDPVQLPNCRAFDVADGDANKLSECVGTDVFDYLHASQSLEHMIDPRLALLDWSRVVKKDGYIVCTVPDWFGYEGMRYPSKWNPDHKSAWSLWKRTDGQWPIFIHVPAFIRQMESHGLKCLLSRLVDTNFDWSADTETDQTWPEDGAEIWIEMVFQKV